MKEVKKIMILIDFLHIITHVIFLKLIEQNLEDIPFLLQNEFNNVTFWMNIMSNVTTDKIFMKLQFHTSIVAKPDLIIFCSGLNDARPD